MARLGEDRQPRVAVEVDEPGSHDQAGGIDHPAGDPGRASDLRGIEEDLEAIAGDAQGAGFACGARSVDQRPADDDDVERLHAGILAGGRAGRLPDAGAAVGPC